MVHVRRKFQSNMDAPGFSQLDIVTILRVLQWLAHDPDSGDALSNAFGTSQALNKAGRELPNHLRRICRRDNNNFDLILQF